MTQPTWTVAGTKDSYTKSLQQLTILLHHSAFKIALLKPLGELECEPPVSLQGPAINTFVFQTLMFDIVWPHFGSSTWTFIW